MPAIYVGFQFYAKIQEEPQGTQQKSFWTWRPSPVARTRPLLGARPGSISVMGMLRQFAATRADRNRPQRSGVTIS